MVGLDQQSPLQPSQSCFCVPANSSSKLKQAVRFYLLKGGEWGASGPYIPVKPWARGGSSTFPDSPLPSQTGREASSGNSWDPRAGGKGGPQEVLGFHPGTAAKPTGEYPSSHTERPALPGVRAPCPGPHPLPHCPHP